MQTSCLEMYRFTPTKIEKVDPVENDIKIPGAGEIYSIALNEETDEIVFASFNGLYFGKIEGVNGNPDVYPFKWKTTKVLF